MLHESLVERYEYTTQPKGSCHGQKGQMNKVCPSFCSEVFIELALQSFSGTQHGVRNSCGVVYHSQITPKMGKIGQVQGSLNVQESSGFFSVLYFVISLVYNESFYYCNSCMLEQTSYLGKFWFLRYGPKCSWPIRLQDFSINRRTLKLAVSHKEINEINWFLVCPSNSFLRNGSLGFSDFWHNGR